MPTTIIIRNNFGEEVGIETSEFAEYRSILGKEDFEFKGHTIVGYLQNEDGTIDFNGSFMNFRDIDYTTIFLKDTKKAIAEQSFGPSWEDFIECLTTGALFAIITARGHESPIMRKSVEYIIDNCLTNNQKQLMYNNLLKYRYLFNKNVNADVFSSNNLSSNKLVKKYLGMCEYIGVSSPSRFDNTAALNPEKAKLEALLKFKSKVNKAVGNIGMKARIGFSDDDNKTVKAIEDLFSELDHEEFPNIIGWFVKNTNDPNNITKKVTERE
jgi:hypothetical protein